MCDALTRALRRSARRLCKQRLVRVRVSDEAHVKNALQFFLAGAQLVDLADFSGGKPLIKHIIKSAVLYCTTHKLQPEKFFSQ